MKVRILASKCETQRKFHSATRTVSFADFVESNECSKFLESCLTMMSTTSREKTLNFLSTLIASPRDGRSLKLVSGSQVKIDDFVKTTHTDLSVGNYGIGDGDFFFQNSAGELFPVVGNFPVLLLPEKLTKSGEEQSISLKLPQYEEAYSEMEHYNKIGEQDEGIPEALLKFHMRGAAEPGVDLGEFPDPPKIWVDAVHDSTSQYEAYKYLSPIGDKTFLQMGGCGTHAVKALLGGASVSILLTPMLGEALYATKLARHYGVEDRFFAVIGVGEELPFKSRLIDAIFSGGCLHHMRTDLAFKEIRRVLKEGGRFACVDPWKTTLHAIGTKLLGKREVSVFCRPIDSKRLEPITVFEKHIVKRHGPILRYFFLGLSKAGFELSPTSMMMITKVDDLFGRVTGEGNWGGGSILICGER